ncbi:hypothetical protein Taro_005239, partial [Colocasia esculenta]|nr:hypothetical protein [Colocasia esculenta]
PPPAFPPPPPPYRSGEGEYRPWDADQRAGYGPGPVYPAVQHVAHEVSPGPYAGEEEEGGRGQHWWHRRHGHGHGDGHQGEPPFSVQPVSHETCGSGTVAPAALPRTVRVFTKAGEDYSLSIREGKVVLARADRGDEYQHWIKDEKFSTKVKDKEGFPCFALVNKVTGEAIKHSIGASHPVRLVPYNPDYLDESVLWTLALDTGEGFRAIRMVNNTSLNFDALHGDDDHGGVHDGTTVVLWEWWKGKNQRWKIVPYYVDP